MFLESLVLGLKPIYLLGELCSIVSISFDLSVLLLNRVCLISYQVSLLFELFEIGIIPRVVVLSHTRPLNLLEETVYLEFSVVKLTLELALSLQLLSVLLICVSCTKGVK